MSQKDESPLGSTDSSEEQNEMPPSHRFGETSRRSFLASTAVVGGVAGLGGLGSTDSQQGDYQEIPKGTTVQLEKVADGLTHPLGFEIAPEDADRRFILDQTGQVYVLKGNELKDEPFLDISDKIVDLGVPQLGGYDERGLLGLEFHPNFSNNRKFYVRYSAPNREGTPDAYNHTSVLSEFRATEDLSQGDPDSERTLMEIPHPQMNHNSGQIVFGPDDGYLYVGMGDGGGSGDLAHGHVNDWYDKNEGGNGQDVKQNLLGGIYRIDVDNQEGDKAYAIPDDNPLVGQEGRDEYYAWGLRNPFRMSFNDGQLFVGDLGQDLFEEVNIVEKGGNYGWNVREGTHGFQTENMLAPPKDRPTTTPDDVRGGEPLIDPIIEFAHSGTTATIIDGNSVIGGYVYGTMSGKRIEGTDAMKPLQGKYVFGNWSRRGFTNPEGVLFAATPPEQSAETTPVGPAEYPGSEKVRETGAESADAGTDGGPQLWPLEELQIADCESGELNEYVMSLGRDQDGELYVLTAEEPEPEGDSGKVYKFAGAESGTESTDGADEYTWLDATHDAYWYSFDNLDVISVYSGNGVLASESDIVSPQRLKKRIKRMLKVADLNRPTIKNPNLNIAPFTTGSATYIQEPVWQPRPNASTLVWDESLSSGIVSPASVAWTGLKEVLWLKNLQNHLGALPKNDEIRFETMVFGTLAQLSIKWSLLEGNLLKNDCDGMQLVSKFNPETGEVVDGTPRPMQHASMLWFLSDMTSVAQTGWYGYEHPEPLISPEKIQQLTDQMAKTTMDAFSPQKIVEMGSTRDLGVMLGAVGWYGTHAGSEELRQRAIDYANALANAVSENIEENGRVKNGAENQAATQGVIGQGLLWASQIDGVSHRDMAESALEYMLELWDDEAGTFATGMGDTTYTITARDAGDVTGGVNAAEAVLGWDHVQPIFAEYFNNTFNRGRLQRAQLKTSYSHADEYLLPLPEAAGGEYGESPAYNTEVTYDTRMTSGK